LEVHGGGTLDDVDEDLTVLQIHPHTNDFRNFCQGQVEAGRVYGVRAVAPNGSPSSTDTLAWNVSPASSRDARARADPVRACSVGCPGPSYVTHRSTSGSSSE